MMMIRRLGVTVGTLLVAGVFLTPTASAATSVPTYEGVIANGGSNGWGTCGFNASGGIKNVDWLQAPVRADDSRYPGRGLGGFPRHADCDGPSKQEPVEQGSQPVSTDGQDGTASADVVVVTL